MEEKMSLDAIGVRKRTDKSSLLHNYLVEYEKEFPNPEEVTKVVEIGLQRGGKWRTNDVSPSVEMWLEFFPNSHVTGFDIKNLKFKNTRVSFIQGDQGKGSDISKLRSSVEDVDLIIDDGSHESCHQYFTFLALWPKVKSGGVYIIEDMNPVVQKELPKELKIHELIKPLMDKTKMSWRYVDSENAGKMSSLIIRKH